jgi:hypothetical protein
MMAKIGAVRSMLRADDYRLKRGISVRNLEIKSTAGRCPHFAVPTHVDS